MPIDIEQKGSPGWWFRYLSDQQFRPPKPQGGRVGAEAPVSRFKRLQMLRERHEGNPPLPEGAENAREAYRTFQRKSRLNLAELIDEAVRERMNIVGFRTAASNDENGDAEAAKLWNANEMPVEFREVLDFMLSMGDGYTIVGPPPEGERLSVITAEDPRQVITAHDPVRPSRVRAALKLFFDEEEERDRAFIYLPASSPLPGGRTSTRASVHEALRNGKNSIITDGFRMAPKAWDWVKTDPVELPSKRVPVTRYRNRRGMAEFEPFIDDLDRINHEILQRMVIATLQAFKQRAVKGVPSHYPKGHPLEGQEVNYSEIFTADPGALWLLPAGAEMWESGEAQMTGVLSSIKDDVTYLMAESRTPFYAISPDAANGSAEGASLQREGLVYKVEDRIARASVPAAGTMSLAFEMQADAQRAELGALEPMWAAVERFSLSERYDAATKAKSSGVPELTIWSDILQFSPAQVQRMVGERRAEQLLAAIPSSTGGGQQDRQPLVIPPAQRVDQRPDDDPDS